MGRPRRLHPRPAVHLLDAAGKHAATMRDEPEPSEEPNGEAEQAEPSQQSRRSRAQRRNREGKFA